ncbi:MAG: hypothetical protein RL681_528 [Candidatus Parcubacteria bacterium]|jgi:hypothetical protein
MLSGLALERSFFWITISEGCAKMSEQGAGFSWAKGMVGAATGTTLFA